MSDDTVDVAPGELEVGDRLRFTWTSKGGASRELTGEVSGVAPAAVTDPKTMEERHYPDCVLVQAEGASMRSLFLVRVPEDVVELLGSAHDPDGEV